MRINIKKVNPIVANFLIAGVICCIWGISDFAEYRINKATNNIVSYIDYGINNYSENKVNEVRKEYEQKDLEWKVTYESYLQQHGISLSDLGK